MAIAHHGRMPGQSCTPSQEHGALTLTALSLIHIFKLETQHILYDETLDFAAAAERAAFLTRCQALRTRSISRNSSAALCSSPFMVYLLLDLFVKS